MKVGSFTADGYCVKNSAGFTHLSTRFCWYLWHLPLCLEVFSLTPTARRLKMAKRKFAFNLAKKMSSSSWVWMHLYLQFIGIPFHTQFCLFLSCVAHFHQGQRNLLKTKVYCKTRPIFLTIEWIWPRMHVWLVFSILLLSSLQSAMCFEIHLRTTYTQASLPTFKKVTLVNLRFQ